MYFRDVGTPWYYLVWGSLIKGVTNNALPQYAPLLESLRRLIGLQFSGEVGSLSPFLNNFRIVDLKIVVSLSFFHAMAG